MENFARIWSVNYLDNIELLYGSFQNKIFPWHSHETYCLSVIESGEEMVEITSGKISLSPGEIFLIGPNTVHRNYSLTGNTYFLRTFYISQDVARFLVGSERTIFQGCYKFNNRSLFEELLALHKRLETDEYDVTEKDIRGVLSKVFLSLYEFNQEKFIINDKTSKSKVFNYIENNLGGSLKVEDLAALVNLNKYQFIRSFKKHLGITPIEYVLQRRLEKARVSLKKGNTIVSTALDAGFYDQSHFSNYFKKYVGVTPFSYQKGCKILQDSGKGGL